MGFNLDFKELETLISSTTDLEGDFNQFLREFLLQMAERILAKVKPRTPVDTGELKRSWELGEIQGEGKNISVEILNGMEYATEIEYGHRIVVNGSEVGWYEGRFMLKISIDEIRLQMPIRYQIELMKFCKKHGLKV